MSQTHLHSPVDEAVYLRGEAAAAKRALMGDKTCRIDKACMRLALDLHEDTGLIVV